MQLLYPIGLFALAGLIVPLIIHLWNIKYGKTLKIGSIFLLGKSSSSSTRSYKITDWLLFILRCLILTLITLIVAQPFLSKKLGKDEQKGWVVVGKSQLPAIWKSERKTLDSLMKHGYELHDFALGFKELNISDTIQNPISKETPGLSETPLTYSSLISQLNKILPGEFPVYLYSNHRQNRLGNELQRVSFDLKWIETKEADSVSTWLANAGNKVMEGVSTPGSITYKLVNTDHQPELRNVLIYEGNNTTDATYIKAALNAIGNFSGRNLKIKNLSSTDDSSISEADLVFWLSDKSSNAVVKLGLKKGARLFTYEAGKMLENASLINLDEANKGATPEIDLTKSILVKRYPGKALWMDGFGTPVLSIENKGNYAHYHFYSKFNPQWSNLVWKEQFVKAIMPIVLGKEENLGFENRSDDQRLWDKDLKTTKLESGSKSTTVISSQTALTTALWICALLIFIAERILSLSIRKEIVSG
jgi:hypothetical protein